MNAGLATPYEKLQPCLFDRLIDEEPQKNVESRNSRVISLSDYRTAVLRDMSWLMNTNCHMESEGLSEFPWVEASVFNFGTPSFSGMSVAGMQVDEMEASVARAIRNFEPRIVADTLVVRKADEKDATSPSTVVFEIRGELWARPFPEKLFIKTNLDMETGAVTF